MDRLQGSRRALTAALVAGVLLAVSSLLIAVLEGTAGVPDASAAYLLAILVTAAAFGTATAIATAAAAFVLYDFLFVEPRFTLTVHDPGEWLNLLLLLLVGIVVARLAGALRQRADAARARELEARAMFRVSRALATRPDTARVLPEIAAILRAESGSGRVWIVLDGPGGREHRVSDSERGAPMGRMRRQVVLRRMPGDTPAEWVRVHQPDRAPGSDVGTSRDAPTTAYRVRIEAAGHSRGDLWVERDSAIGPPDRSATRLLSTAADQLGQILEQDRLAGEAQAAEVARQSDALKSALLESVSHDLRTPLASIRVAAGTLLDPEVRLSDEDRIATAAAIDREAEHLARLVTNLLDLSRIEAGVLRADREPFDLDDIVPQVVDRVRPRLDGRDLLVDLPASLPSVLLDPVFFEQVLGNLLENEGKYVPLGARIVISAAVIDDRVRLTVEDDGPGVPPEALDRLFEKFFRVRRRGESSRPGTGIGLAVVRGLVEAMGGRVQARWSGLGGLAVDTDLVVAPPRPDAATDPDGRL